MSTIRSQIRAALGSHAPADVPLGYVRETIQQARTTLDLSGMRGTRSALAARLIAGPRAVSGEIELEPSLGDLVALLPWILGGTWNPGAGSTFQLSTAELISDFVLAIDRAALVYRYDGCKFVAARLIAARGAPVMLNLKVEGLSETWEESAELPVAPIGLPLRFEDVRLVLSGVPRECSRVEIAAENIPLLDRYAGTLDRIDLPIVDRRLGILCEVPYELANADLDANQIGPRSVQVRLTAGTESIEFQFPRVGYVTSFSKPTAAGPLRWTVEARPGAEPGHPELIVVHTP